MKIPSTLRILGHDIAIEIVDQSVIPGFHGDCQNAYLKLRIADCYPESTQIETLPHEVIEYINDSLELEMKHQQVQALSVTLYQVFADNQTMEVKK